MGPLDHRDVRGRQCGFRVPATVLRHALRCVRWPCDGELEDPVSAVLQLQLRPFRARRRDHREHIAARRLHQLRRPEHLATLVDRDFRGCLHVDVRQCPPALPPDARHRVEPVSLSGSDSATTDRRLPHRRLPHPIPGHHDLQRDRAATSGADAERRLRSDPAVGRGQRGCQRIAIPARSPALQRSVRRGRRRSHHSGAFARARRPARAHPQSAQPAERRCGP